MQRSSRVRHLVDHPFEQLSLNGIARASGVSLCALRYNYDNPDRLFRSVGLRLVERVVQEFDGMPAPSAGALDTIGAARRFHRRIESELALAALLPSPANEEPPETERLPRDTVREAVEATCVFEWASDPRRRPIEANDRNRRFQRQVFLLGVERDRGTDASHAR